MNALFTKPLETKRKFFEINNHDGEYLSSSHQSQYFRQPQQQQFSPQQHKQQIAATTNETAPPSRMKSSQPHDADIDDDVMCIAVLTTDLERVLFAILFVNVVRLLKI
jgi:hypothetical protein